MAFVFGIPASKFLRRLFTGPLTLIKTILVYIWLELTNKNPRFVLFDYKSHDLYKLSGLINPEHTRLDNPQVPTEKHISDSVLVYGGNSSGGRLVARVCREHDGHVAWLYLRLPDGRSYQLLKPDNISPPSGDFDAADLRLRCLIPMRKWRIAFNGLLRETKDQDKSSGSVVHIKFSFIVNHNGYPFDLQSDIHPSLMADYLSRRDTFPFPPGPKKATQFLDNYWQPCNILGTVIVDGEKEMEVYLWGARKRSRDSLVGKQKNSFLSNELFGYSKAGQNVYTGRFLLPGSKQWLTVGHYRERNGIVWPVKFCEQVFYNSKNDFNEMKVKIITERARPEITTTVPFKRFTWSSGKALNHVTMVHLMDFKFNDEDEGHAILVENTGSGLQSPALNKVQWRLTNPVHEERVEEEDFVLTLDDPKCQMTALAGGKGASLAGLSYLTARFQTQFTVPWGLVVTTDAYWRFLSKSGTKVYIDECDKACSLNDSVELHNACNRAVNEISKAVLPGYIRDAIVQALYDKFGNDTQTQRMAVRSSASGEDSEEMSAAGQMSTFLGIQGTENVIDAVVKCWASQFSFTAIQYKRQYGQELNSAMAVVVQEMIPADTAGVLFTCDPVTGDPRNVTITANYGIGESVVSASADPDTLVMERDEHNGVTLKNVTLGRKKTKIIMSDYGSVVETSNDENSASICCLPFNQAKILADTSLMIEDAYGFPVDVEWAFRNGKLHLVQARPVTTFYKETDFEIVHSADTPLRIEDEYFTKSNIGEILPGFISHLTLSLINSGINVSVHRLLGHRNKFMFPFSLFSPMGVVSHSQVFFSMADMLIRFYKKENTFMADSNMIASFGRIIENEEMFKQVELRNSNYPDVFVPAQFAYVLWDLLFGIKRAEKTMKEVWKIKVDLSKCPTSKEMLHTIIKQVFNLTECMSCHLMCTSNSAVYSNVLFGILKGRAKEWNTTLFNDFAKILASCGDLESANVPFSIQELTTEIGKTMDITEFKNKDPMEALEWLETTDSTAGAQYRQFLSRHGHRGYKEFDYFVKPWSMNKLPMIKTLQDSVGRNQLMAKKEVPIEEVISDLKSPLSRTSRFLLKKVIPFCRRGVYNREMTKSLVIKGMDIAREPLWKLARQMVIEGRLPDEELMFFLSNLELEKLIETRSPSLVQSAIRRRQTSYALEKMRFPELAKGPPKPINFNSKIEDRDVISDLEIKGTPVSQGVAKGFARVALNLEEATKIQPGEILIASYTDVGWSPYFPLLSGVVTELGGLISHGAVVAREYGLPCIVAAIDATLKFQTGDFVLLDANRGILKRIDENLQTS